MRCSVRPESLPTPIMVLLLRGGERLEHPLTPAERTARVLAFSGRPVDEREVRLAAAAAALAVACSAHASRGCCAGVR